MQRMQKSIKIGFIGGRIAMKSEMKIMELSTISIHQPTTTIILPQVPLKIKSSRMRRFLDSFSYKKAVEDERLDIELLEQFAELTTSLIKVSIPSDHPLNDLAQKIRDLKSIDTAKNGKNLTLEDTQKVFYCYSSTTLLVLLLSYYWITIASFLWYSYDIILYYSYIILVL